jgi:hypothetical protein
VVIDMTISESMCKKYDKYEDFTSEFVRSAIENESAFLIVNWQDAFGVCQLLNTFTINGNSVVMKCEFADEVYEEIEEVKQYDGNMLITLFDGGEMICEKALSDESAYVDDGVYFVEYSAKDFVLPLHATVIPFKIETQIFDNAF